MYRVVLDIETGGFSKEKNALCSVAVLIIDHNLTIADELYLLIKPHTRRGSEELASYKPEAMKVNGLNEEHLAERGVSPGSAMEVLEGVFKKYEVCTFIGHNIRVFDGPWINEYMQRFGPGWEIGGQCMIDTLEMSRKRWNLPNYDLTNICNHLGIDNKHPHHALFDSRVTLELYRRLIA